MHMHSLRVIRPARSVPDTSEVAARWTPGIGTDYCVDMAPRAVGKTPNRVVRIDDETWAAYARVCEARGISRADAIRLSIKREIAEFEREQRRIAREEGAATSG